MKRFGVVLALVAAVGVALLLVPSAFAGVPPGYRCTTPGLSYLCADIANACRPDNARAISPAATAFSNCRSA